MLLTFPHLSSLPPKLPLPYRYPIPFGHVPLPSPPKTVLFSPRAATTAAGSAADFPEQVAGGTPSQRKRRRTVAGVDQEELVEPTELADPDSAFCELNGVKIHHKITHHQEAEADQEAEITTAKAKIGLPMILLHGFGASVYSWDRVTKPLARFTGSKILAFDRPAFGLTSRGIEQTELALNPYSTAFSVLATISFIDMLGAGKAILMGHSAGCIVAVNTYFEAPEKVAALILVAPAIVAPFVFRKGEKMNGVGDGKPVEDQKEKIESEENLFVRIWKGLRNLAKFIAGMVLQILKGMRDVIRSIYAKALTTVLRSSLGLMLVLMLTLSVL